MLTTNLNQKVHQRISEKSPDSPSIWKKNTKLIGHLFAKNLTYNWSMAIILEYKFFYGRRDT